MRQLLIVCFLLIPFFTAAQDVKPIPRTELDKEYETKFPIYQGFSYQDKSGSWKILLCENQMKKAAKDTISTALQAVCLLEDHGGFLEKWSINDFVEKEAEEERIWFTTSYCSFSDLDRDGRIDPVITYMTTDIDGIRRVKILVVYKNEKYAVRAVEHVSDYGRKLEYAAGYSKLPAQIRAHVEQLLARIRKERGVLLKHG